MAEKVTFEGINKLIVINDGESELDAQRDIYSAWKRWMVDSKPSSGGEINSQWLQALRTTGGDELTPGSYLGAYFFLMNGWRMRPYEGTHQLIVDGNVFVDGGGNPFVPTQGLYNVLVTMNVSSLSTNLVTDIPEIQYSSYGNVVSIDILSTYSGTEYPVGTLKEPVNNMADAILISNSKGFDVFNIIGDITLTGLDLTGRVFVGESTPKTEISVDESADVHEAEFENCKLSGDFDGCLSVNNCVIKNITRICGFVNNSVLQGTIGINTSGGLPTHFLDCKSGHGITPEGMPVLDLTLATSKVVLRHYSGGITLRNLTVGEITIDMNSGRVILEDNMTGGKLVVRGSGELVDNSKGTIVDSEFFINHNIISEAVWSDSLSHHTSAGTAGEIINKIKKLAALIPAGL